MAAQTIHRLLLLSLLAISAAARPGRPFHPCHQTLILFSTSTSSSSSSFPLLDNSSPQNPNPDNNFRRTQSITLFITEFRPLDFYHPIPSIPTVDHHREDPSSLYSSSFRDRTRDILSVVGSLLFGVGCGALTAATMYLVWSLFAANHFDPRDDSEDEFDSDKDDDVSPKRMGYVAIPTPAHSDYPVVVAKEVV